jgi:hypothetical protein
MNKLLLAVAAVDVVKLQLVVVEQQVAHGDGVVLAEVLEFSEHDALHADIERLVGVAAVDSGLLVVMSQLTGIVGHAYLKLVAQVALGIFYLGAVAVRKNLRDSYLFATLDTKIKDGSGRLLVAGSPCIDDEFVGYQFLGISLTAW